MIYTSTQHWIRMKQVKYIGLIKNKKNQIHNSKLKTTEEKYYLVFSD